MFCTKCGHSLQEGDRFCPQCGDPKVAGAEPFNAGSVIQAPQILMLDKRRKKVAGVCAGFSRYFDTDLVLMRVLWLAIAVCTGVGFLVYLAAWIVIPSDHGLDVPVKAVSTDSLISRG